MPYIDDGKRSEYYSKISKKKEEVLRKKGLKPYDVRYGVSFPRGGKIKVWAKNEEDAYDIGENIKTGIMIAPTVYSSPPSVRTWKNPKHPKTRMKRKGNPRFRPVRVKRTHPKTGKKFTQIVYKHSKDWYRH